RVNMAYTSSIVMYGDAEGIVVRTGMDTEVGKIARMLDNQEELDTPLKRKLNSVGKTLSMVGHFTPKKIAPGFNSAGVTGGA
ncbi:MAG: hypothetical protein ACI4QX_03520, partial [Lachnospiraceae bacterium]